MTYAISNLQLCPICLDEEKPINPSLDHPTIDRETLLKRKVKVLRCNHLFHYECINKFFFEGGTKCPYCRSPIEKEDRFFSLIKDPYGHEDKSPKNWETYISKNENGNSSVVFEGSIPQEEREFILRNQERIIDHAMKKPGVSFTIPVASLNQFFTEVQSVNSLQELAPNIEVNYLVDENGICHITIPSNNNEKS
ncbi:MAG: hypothetical protein Q8K60_05480 [Parachlamydiaceae bacterium]|nr:hypothetical protein [Parachlamydiaceae bacterium]